MFRKAFLLVFVFSLCSFFHTKTIQKNMHDRWIDKSLGKEVKSLFYPNGTKVFYTTELSRILLAPRKGMFVKSRVGRLLKALHLTGKNFDSRFDEFISQVGLYSDYELKETIKDVILLTPLNVKTYWVEELLDNLIEYLENKITNITSDCTFDQMYLNYTKRYVLITAFLAGVLYMTDAPNPQIERKATPSELVHSYSVLSLIPSCYRLLKSSYNTLTVNPQYGKKYLKKYETLLIYVKGLKDVFNANGSISFELSNGVTAKLEDNGYKGSYKDQFTKFIYDKAPVN